MSYSKGGGYFWARLAILQYGILITNRDTHKPLFSVRNGYIKEWTVTFFGVQYGFQFLGRVK